MNKRNLGIALFFTVCALYSLYNAFRAGFDHISLTLFLGFGFLSFLFFRNIKRK